MTEIPAERSNMYIAIDIGSSFFKLALLEISKDNINILSNERTAVKRVETCSPDEYEYDISAISERIRQFIDSAAETGNIRGILITTQMHGFVLRNIRTDKTYNYISWQDERCLKKYGDTTYLEYLKSSVPAEVISCSGMRLKCEMAFCNLFAMSKDKDLRLSDGYEVYTLGSYIIHSLCGRNITHITNAAPTGFYDLRHGCVPNEQLLHGAGMSGMVLPQVACDIEPCGEYRSIPVYPDVGDQQVCIYGSDIGSDTLNINIGTATQMSAICEVWEPEFYESIYEIRPYFDKKYLKTVTKLPGGRSLQVIADFFGDVITTFTGKEMSNRDIWDIIMEISDKTDSTLGVKTGFFRGLLYNIGRIYDIDYSNLNSTNLASGAFSDLAHVYDGIIPRIDPGHKADKIMICGKFGKIVRSHMECLENSAAYKILLSDSSDESFVGLGKLIQRKMK